MAFMRRVENVVWAFPGTPEGTGPFTREDGLKGATHAPGGLFPGSKHTGIPQASVQRRALQLAELTGSIITMSRGEHYNPSMAGTDATWFVSPAAHSQYRPRAQSGWLVTVSSSDGIIGYQHTRHDFRTWPQVLDFLRVHFPRPTETVTDDAIVDAVNDVFGDGFGETVGDLGSGDAVWAGITELDGEWYGREQNDYGQSVTYRFGNEDKARSWLFAIESSLMDAPL